MGRTNKEIAVEYLGALVIQSEEALALVVSMWNSKLEAGVLIMLEEDKAAYYAENQDYYCPEQIEVDNRLRDYAQAIIDKAIEEVK